MALDPHNLRPSELCRLLNSSPLGEVINERKLYKYRMRAGYRLGSGKTVNLLRFFAWAFEQRHFAKPTPKPEEQPRNVRFAARRKLPELPAIEETGNQ